MAQKKAVFIHEPAETTQQCVGNVNKENAIAAKLAKSPLIDATNVKVTVIGDEVHISGAVICNQDVPTAGNLALSVNGISRVRNTLRVRQPNHHKND